MSQNNNVVRYRIIDNGDGMTDDNIINALKLGSSMEYGPHSLSKLDFATLKT